MGKGSTGALFSLFCFLLGLTPLWTVPLELRFMEQQTGEVFSTVSWIYFVQSGTVARPHGDYEIFLGICADFVTSNAIVTASEGGSIEYNGRWEGSEMYAIKWKKVFHVNLTVTIRDEGILDQSWESGTWYYSKVGAEEGFAPAVIPGPGCGPQPVAEDFEEHFED
mmetsp:Transcript_14937/g.20862  ORF Transcript_14937/g.20862 Transcript_14937/m.20862 type:complete len:166 (-) Transcript_14937:32-529(-)